MEENISVSHQAEDRILYPMADATLDKDMCIPSRNTTSVDDGISGQNEELINSTSKMSSLIPIPTSNQSPLIPQKPSPALPSRSQQVVSTNITTSGSNPLQVSVKTVSGTNTIVNQTLINTIVNSDAVQTLLRDNPGQPITIVRMPEAMHIPNYPVTPINDANLNPLKTKKRNCTPLSLRGRRGGRRTKLGVAPQKTDFLQFQKSLQFKTRSGRVSKPPLYRVKETLRTNSGGQSNKTRDGVAMGTDKVDNNDMQQKVSGERSPLEVTGHTTTPGVNHRGQSTGKGHRGFSRGRRRGRASFGNFGNRLSSSKKVKELLLDISDEDLISTAMPRLSEIVSPFDFLLMRTFKKRKSEPDKTNFEVLLEDFEDLLNHVKSLSRDCLVSEREADRPWVEVSSTLAEALGVSKGYIRDIPTESLHSSIMKMVESPADYDTAIAATDEGGIENLPVTKTPAAAATHVNDLVQNANRRLGDKILGVGTVFPDNALKTNKRSLFTAPSTNNLSVPAVGRLVQVKAAGEASDVDITGMMVNVEELDSTALHSGTNDFNLNQTVQLPHSAGPVSESEPTPLHVPSNALSGQEESLLQVPPSILSETGSLQVPSNDLTSPVPIPASGLGIGSVQAESEVIQGIVPDSIPSARPLQPATAPMVPEGSTIIQMEDGNFLVEKPDGTAMQIQAPEGMTIETIQALLTVETEVFDQTDPERPGVPAAIETSDQATYLSVEDSVGM